MSGFACTRSSTLKVLWLVLPTLVLAGCSNERGKKGSSDKATQPTSQSKGVDPERFQCDDVAPLDELTAILGGKVVAVETHFEPPRGVARPCSYIRLAAGATARTPDEGEGEGEGGDEGESGSVAEGEEPWNFDLDCRAKALENADKLIEQYRTTALDRKKASEAQPPEPKSPKKSGGKPEAKPAAPAAPITEAVDLDIGRKALDHNGQSLIFVDDDAPCYVRVNGPRADGREGVARLIVKRLTEVNAPTGRRYDN